MKKSIVALMVGVFTIASVALANETVSAPAADTSAAKSMTVEKKAKKKKKNKHGKKAKEAPAAEAPAAEAAPAAPAEGHGH